MSLKLNLTNTASNILCIKMVKGIIDNKAVLVLKIEWRRPINKALPERTLVQLVDGDMRQRSSKHLLP